MRIRAAVLREPGRVVVEEVELDGPKRAEVLVKVAAAGVCHSDLHLVDGDLGEGRWPMVLGHEGAGVVEAIGEGVHTCRRRRPGRVLVRPLVSDVPGLPRRQIQLVRPGR